MNKKQFIAWACIGLIAVCFVLMLVCLFIGQLQWFMGCGTIFIILVLLAWLFLKGVKKNREEQEAEE